jgi:hypothetical protein
MNWILAASALASTGNLGPLPGPPHRAAETPVARKAASPPRASAPIAYERLVVGKAVYHVIVADIPSGAVTTGMVHANQLTSVWKLVGSPKPSAALTGTFFSLQSERPVADVLVNGNLVAKGSLGTVVAVDWWGKVRILDRGFKSPMDWGEYRYGLRGTVRVVRSGVVEPNPKAQRFRDRRIWGRSARTALGLTKSGKLVLMATQHPVSLSELGWAMTKLGVVDGVSLDGGGSACLYYQGSLIVPPKRKLSNLVVLYTAKSKPTIAPIKGIAGTE